MFFDGDCGGSHGIEEREPLLCTERIGGAGVNFAGAEERGFLAEARLSREF